MRAIGHGTTSLGRILSSAANNWRGIGAEPRFAKLGTFVRIYPYLQYFSRSSTLSWQSRRTLCNNPGPTVSPECIGTTVLRPS